MHSSGGDTSQNRLLPLVCFNLTHVPVSTVLSSLSLFPDRRDSPVTCPSRFALSLVFLKHCTCAMTVKAMTLNPGDQPSSEKENQVDAVENTELNGVSSAKKQK